MKIAPTPLACTFHPGNWDDVPKDAEGRVEPGSMFWITFSGGKCSTHEPGCEKHLVVVTPDGHWWDIDSRASNCTMKEDKVHRCWVRHGDPPNVTVDKQGATCNAGAGSIQTPDWHGFLRDGKLIT